MNFYSFHIGDYASHTRHLTLIEDLAYRRMIDLYYTAESPLPLDAEKVARLIGMRDHMQAVSEVLSDFFVKSEDGHTNSRCDKEIDLYHKKADRAKSANKARWAPDKSDPDVKSDLKSENDQIATKNQEPLTTNQKPLKEKAKAPPPALPDLFDGVSPQVVADFKALRKSKKLPITQTAIDGIQREADKARVTLEAALTMCCERGWAGFKAEWVAAPAARASPAHGYQTANEKAKSWCDELLGVTQNDQHNEFIDITPAPGFLD